jgi:glycine/D-amino acid oxidase-like deaminating enzyme
MQNAVLWSSNGEAGLELPAPVELPAQVDVAIVGGGFTGLSAALTLARGGASVVVLERRTAGWGASGRNGGQLSVGGKRPASAWVKQYGPELGGRLWRASVESVDFVERLIESEGIECHYHRRGLLSVAWKPEHFGHLAAKQQSLAETFGYEVELVPPLRLREELGSAGYHGGLVDPHAGQLNPYLLARGLAAAAARAGAVICEHSEVTALSRMGDEHVLVTDGGTVHTAEVLIATNGYTGPLTPQLRRRIVPVGSHQIATEPLDEDLALSCIPRRRTVYDTKGMLFYFRLSDDDRMVFGGRVSWTFTASERAGPTLRRQMVALFPQLAAARVEFAWGGCVGMTMDLDPRLGRMDGLHYAVGYCGHGVGLAPYLGDRIAQLIAGRPVDCPFLELKPFPAVPLYSGHPWFLPIVGGYYRVKDRLV